MLWILCLKKTLVIHIVKKYIFQNFLLFNITNQNFEVKALEIFIENKEMDNYIRLIVCSMESRDIRISSDVFEKSWVFKYSFLLFGGNEDLVLFPGNFYACFVFLVLTFRAFILRSIRNVSLFINQHLNQSKCVF